MADERKQDPSGSGLYPMIGTRGSRWYLHWSAVIGALVLGLCCVLFTGLPLLGRVAWADETDRKMRAYTAAALEPMQTQIGELTDKVSQQSDLLKEQVVASLSSNICRYNVRRNKEPDIEERLRITTQINEMRSKYAKFTGYEFNMADC